MATTILTHKLTPADIFNIGNNGVFFTIVFQKESGELRHMVCRLGVSKHVKGSGKAKPKDACIVWDSVKQQYRSFRYDRVLFASRGTLDIVSLLNGGLQAINAYRERGLEAFNYA